ncbi:hypothetical protein Nepgr_002814 [Nepenthes gracilis]|uniref:Uncharacterized protein n=1 Tax=Nepenthes gracilis TaxID=150966 RepID=A0AAD3P4B6_NEPGR|nr:hypothetical protein Nepgr_002814 [Nepenthes gracilis]
MVRGSKPSLVGIENLRPKSLKAPPAHCKPSCRLGLKQFKCGICPCCHTVVGELLDAKFGVEPSFPDSPAGKCQGAAYLGFLPRCLPGRGCFLTKAIKAGVDLVADGLEKTPASCSSITADLFGLDALRLVVDHEQPNAASGDQVVQCHIEVIQNPLRCGTHTSSVCPPEIINEAITVNQNFCGHDSGSTQGMPTDSGYLEDQAQPVADVFLCGDQYIEWHQVSYVEALRRGIPADSTGSHGAGVAPIPQNPITDVDWLEALGTSNYPEVGVGSAISSSIHDALSFPQGGVLRYDTNSKKLCRNLADLR